MITGKSSIRIQVCKLTVSCSPVCVYWLVWSSGEKTVVTLDYKPIGSPTEVGSDGVE